MKIGQNKLVVRQFDDKMKVFAEISNISAPGKGWLNTVRIALRMSLRQFGKRLGINPSSANEIEKREADGSITLKTLRDAADVLGVKLVYFLIPKDESLEKFIERRANEIATKIITRTSQSMKLEDQENSAERIREAIKEKTEEIKSTMPKYLWD